jgi:hypothetical protein
LTDALRGFEYCIRWVEAHIVVRIDKMLERGDALVVVHMQKGSSLSFD